MIITERQKLNFLKKFEQGTLHECWEWNASTTNGYGQVSGLGLAHRISYELFVGPIPEGMNVLHKCDNHGCVNSNHLFLGTLKDNTQDMIKKGRNYFYGDQSGEKNFRAKLTKENVAEIRNSNLTNKELIKKYNVSLGQICNIKNWKRWKQL